MGWMDGWMDDGNGWMGMVLIGLWVDGQNRLMVFLMVVSFVFLIGMCVCGAIALRGLPLQFRLVYFSGFFSGLFNKGSV